MNADTSTQKETDGKRKKTNNRLAIIFRKAIKLLRVPQGSAENRKEDLEIFFCKNR